MGGPFEMQPQLYGTGRSNVPVRISRQQDFPTHALHLCNGLYHGYRTHVAHFPGHRIRQHSCFYRTFVNLLKERHKRLIRRHFFSVHINNFLVYFFPVFEDKAVGNHFHGTEDRLSNHGVGQ